MPLLLGGPVALAIDLHRQPDLGAEEVQDVRPNRVLAVEIDGQSHWSAEQERHDARRDAYLLEMGIETLRLSTESLKRPGAAAERILAVLTDRAS